MSLQKCVSPDGHQRGPHSNNSAQRSPTAPYFYTWHDEFNCRRCHTFIYINRLNQSYSCALQIRELLPRFGAFDGLHLRVASSVFNTHKNLLWASVESLSECLALWRASSKFWILLTQPVLDQLLSESHLCAFLSVSPSGCRARLTKHVIINNLRTSAF